VVVPQRDRTGPRRRLRDEALTQLGVDLPQPIDVRLDMLLLILDADAGVRTSRRELMAALILAANDPAALAEGLRRYSEARVGDVAVPDYPGHWILTEVFAPDPRRSEFGDSYDENWDRVDERFPEPIPEMLREKLTHTPLVRVGLAVPRPLSVRLDQLVELVERKGLQTTRQDLLSLLIFIASDEPDVLENLLRRYRVAEVDDAFLSEQHGTTRWKALDSPPRGRRPRPKTSAEDGRGG